MLRTACEEVSETYGGVCGAFFFSGQEHKSLGRISRPSYCGYKKEV
jgi:hypothetical protein